MTLAEMQASINKLLLIGIVSNAIVRDYENMDFTPESFDYCSDCDEVVIKWKESPRESAHRQDDQTTEEQTWQYNHWLDSHIKEE